jgi:hypothetical protein
VRALRDELRFGRCPVWRTLYGTVEALLGS